MEKTIRLYTRTGIGNQLQFIPVIKSLAKNNYLIYSNSPVLNSLLSNYLRPPNKPPKSKYDFGILLYHQGLPDAWKAKKECRRLIGFPYSFKIVNHNEIPILSRLFLSNRDTFDENITEIENNMKLLRFFGITEEEVDYTVPIPRNPEAKVIGISAGSGAHSVKRWQYYPDLINSLPHKKFRLFGTENSLNRAIINRTTHNNAKIIHTDDVASAATEIARCEMFISNDNGLMHLADLLQVPTIAIFGMTNIARNRPWNKNSHVISKNLSCSPCYHNGSINCTNPVKYTCMDISVETVINKIAELENSL